MHLSVLVLLFYLPLLKVDGYSELYFNNAMLTLIMTQQFWVESV